MQTAIVLATIGLAIISMMTVKLLILLFKLSDTDDINKLSRQIDKVAYCVVFGAALCMFSIVILFVNALLTL